LSVTRPATPRRSNKISDAALQSIKRSIEKAAAGVNDAGEAAPPLGGPAAKLDGVVGERGQHLELMFGRPSFALSRMEIIGVQKELHKSRVASQIEGLFF